MRHQISDKINRFCTQFSDQCIEADAEECMPRKHHEHLARLFLLAFNDLLQTTQGNPLEFMGQEGAPGAEQWDCLTNFPALTDDQCRVRVCDGILFSYSGGYWRAHPESQLRGYIAGLDGVNVWSGGTSKSAKGDVIPWTAKVKRLGLNHTDKAGILICLREIEKIQDPAFFDQRHDAVGGVCLKNGFLLIDKFHTPTGKKEWRCGLVDHSPSHRATYQLDYNWPTEMPELPLDFIGHLQRCYDGDSDSHSKIAVIQEFVGLAATGFAHRISQARCLLLEGAANSGKSIIHECITRIFPTRDGAGNLLVLNQSPDEWSSGGMGNGGDFKKASWVACVLNSDPDLKKWSCLREASEFKKMITGDPISYRRSGGHGATLYPKAAHIYSNNNVGQDAPETNEGFFRRFNIVTHRNTFTPGEGVARDKVEYLAELTSPDNMFRLFVWGVQGAMRVLRNGEKYTVIASGEQAKQEWRDAADPVAMFLSEACLVGPESSQKWKFVYKNYREWCQHKDIYKIMGSREFEKNLQARGYTISQDYWEGNKQKVIYGLDIKTISNSKHHWKEECA